MTADDIITLFDLKPLTPEGGYFRETYRSPETIPESGLPDRYPGPRVFGTEIYYLLTPDAVSAMHRLISDEFFHFLAGDPVEMLRLFPDGTSETIILGQDVVHGNQLQTVVPHGVWQGASLVSGGNWALLGVTVAPGFDYADYEHGDRDTLIAGWPDCAERIRQLT